MKDVKGVKDVKTVKRTASVRIALIGAFLATSAACGGSAPAGETQATPTTQAAPQNAAQAAQQMAQGLQQLTQSQTTKPVEFEQLIAMLPEPAGWTRSKPSGKQWSMGISMSMAEADYEKGDSSIDLTITDTSFNQMFLAPMSMFLMSSYSERTPDGYKKATTIGGSPGFESWENEDKDAEVTVVVGKRFVVSGKGRNVDNVDVVRSFVQAIDLSKLSSLK
jgi:hypothetical protein